MQSSLWNDDNYHCWAEMILPLNYRARESCHYAVFVPDGFGQSV